MKSILERVRERLDHDTDGGGDLNYCHVLEVLKDEWLREAEVALRESDQHVFEDAIRQMGMRFTWNLGYLSDPYVDQNPDCWLLSMPVDGTTIRWAFKRETGKFVSCKLVN